MRRVFLFIFGLILLHGPAAASTDARDPLAVAFGTLPAVWNVKISPDGSKIVALRMHPEGLPIAIVFDFEVNQPQLVLASVKDRFDIRWCEWANNERLLCGYSGIVTEAFRKLPVTRLVAVNADATAMKVLMQHRLRKTFTQFQDDIVDWLPDDPKHVLIEKPDRNGSGVSRLNIYSGTTRTEARVRNSVREWRSDGHGTLRLRMFFTNRRLQWDFLLAGEKKWRLLHEADVTDIGDKYFPVGFDEDPDLLLVLKPFEERLALWSEDLSNDRASKLVFSHPDVDLQDTLRIGKFRRMVAVAYSTDRPHLHFFDADIEQITNRIGALFPEQMVQVVDESWDRRFHIIHVSSDRAAGTYYRFDAKQNRLDKIASQHPLLGDLTLSPMKPIRYTARDGTDVPAYLTLPSSAPSGPSAAVILPHGGPESRDYWGYDWIVQFLAARGYAVLQSNYRGSGGFGSAWSGDGGFRNWAQAISDISDGARHLIATGVADPQRICIAGWSYGGYAALLSAVEEPELYRCAVSIAGVTDPDTLIDDSRDFIGWRGVKAFVGTDDAVLKRGSPLRRAAEFRAPVLLFHGEDDFNVRLEHSKKMANALKRKKNEVEFIEYEGAEHSIRRNGFRVDMLSRIGAFLDEHTRPSADAR